MKFKLIAANAYLQKFMHQELEEDGMVDLQVESKPVEGERGVSTMLIKRTKACETD